MIRHLVLPVATGMFAAAATFAIAQTAPAPASGKALAHPAKSTPPAKAKPKYDPYGSPLDTMMSTRLWTDVPAPQDFVKTSRPDTKTVDYAPLVGKDPERPKPRDAAGVEALQAELERGGQSNETRAKGLRGATGGAEQHPRKSAKRKTTAASAE